MSEEAEMCVIGGLMLDGEKTDYVFERLPAACFQNGACRRAYEEAAAMRQAGEPVDPVTLAGRLENGKAFLYRCAAAVPSLANFGAYASRVAEDWRKKLLLDSLSGVIRSARPQDTAGELLEKVKQAAAAGEELERKFGGEPGTDYIWAAEKFLRELYAERTYFISTGYKSLDACTGGLLPGSVYVLAGRTGEGKTALALNMALRVAAAGRRVQYFTLEMPAEQLVARAASNLSKIDAARVRDRNLSDEEKTTIARLVTQVNGACINFVDQPVGLDDIRRAADLYRPEVIVVDHVGLVKVDARMKRFEAVGALSRGLKRLALEKELAVIEVVQMNRQVERRASKVPLLSDLRESGDLEQDADGVFFMTAGRGDGVLAGERYLDCALHVKKNRHGRTGTVPLRWQPQYHSIVEGEVLF